MINYLKINPFQHNDATPLGAAIDATPVRRYQSRDEMK